MLCSGTLVSCLIFKSEVLQEYAVNNRLSGPIVRYADVVQCF